MREPRVREPMRLAAALVAVPFVAVADALAIDDAWWRAGIHALDVVAVAVALSYVVDWVVYPRWGETGLDAEVFWPYKPRQGYPSVPAWLLVVLLILGIGLLIGLLGLLEASRDARPV